jgi:hypothetical protein
VTGQNGEFNFTDLEPGTWAYRLCQDGDPNVFLDTCPDLLKFDPGVGEFVIQDGQRLIGTELEDCTGNICRLDLNPLKTFPEIILADEIVTGTSTFRPTFRWDAFPGANHYRVRMFDSETQTLLEEQLATGELFHTLGSSDLQSGGRYEIAVDAISNVEAGWDSDDSVMASGTKSFSISDAITEPMTGNVKTELAVLGDALLQIMVQDRATREWSVYDHTGGDFTLAILNAVNPGNTPVSVGVIADIADGTAVTINVNQDVTFMGWDLTTGMNVVVWNP